MTRLNKFSLKCFSLAIIVCICITSCKKAAKDASEKAIREVSESMLEKSSEKGITGLTKSALRKLDWEDIYKLIEKEDINIAKSISKLDNGTQRAIGKAIQDDPDFLRALMSSRTLLDEFNLYTKSAPKLSKNIDFIRFFAENDYITRVYGRRNPLEGIVLKEEGGTVHFLDKNTSRLIAKYRDGVITLEDPFIKGTKRLSEQSLLRGRLIPNSVYKISDGFGKEYLYNIDNLGRMYSIKAKGISVEEMLTNIIYKDKNVEFGSQWNKELNNIRKTSRGKDISLEYKLDYEGENVVPSYCHLDIYSRGNKIASRTFKNSMYRVQASSLTESGIKLITRFAGDAGFKDFMKMSVRERMLKIRTLTKYIYSLPKSEQEKAIAKLSPKMRDKVRSTRKLMTSRLPSVKKGYFKGERGNIVFVLSDDYIWTDPKTGQKKTVRQLREMYNIKDPIEIPYRDGEPDFSKYAFAKVKVEYKNDIDYRDLKGLHDQVNEKLSKEEWVAKRAHKGEIDPTRDLIENMTVDGKYKRGCRNTYHETWDGETILIVPDFINSTCTHNGGRALAQIVL